MKRLLHNNLQAFLLGLILWGSLISVVQAERYQQNFTYFLGSEVQSQWRPIGNYNVNFQEVCDKLTTLWDGGFFRRWYGYCVSSPSKYWLGVAHRLMDDKWCESGEIFDPLAGQCTNPNQEDEYTIKISTVTAQAYANYLTALEPDKIWRKRGGEKFEQRLNNTVKLTVEVKDQDGNRVNTAIKLKVTVKEGSGGHIQAFHIDRNPLQAGKLKIGTLNSYTINIAKGDMVNGLAEFEFTAPAISGDHKIEATCTDIACEQIGKDSVWVGIQDLQPLPASSNYTFIGKKKQHEENHYATLRVIKKIQGIAQHYHTKFPDDEIFAVNDISLERGGLFDVAPPEIVKWTAPHGLHRTGEDVDIRANETLGEKGGDIPEKNFVYFELLAQKNGCYAERHLKTTDGEHYHLYCTKAQGK